ncbi:MAG TPA: nucleotidyltransferase [Gemmataceae bacterium]|nr:nucleotidyltransferase [Gemmataceae bacterium]
MDEPDYLAPLLAALRDLLAWLRAAKVSGVVIGGVAAGLLGRPRVTRDVDAVILIPDEKRAKVFLDQGALFRFAARIKDPLAFAAQSRVLLVNHQPSGIDVDLSLGQLPFEEEMIARSVAVDVSGLSIPLPTPEDFIIMKAIAHRPRDMADIEAVLDVHPKLDLRRVRRWVRDFAAILEMPELLEDLEVLLARRPPAKKGKKKK